MFVSFRKILASLCLLGLALGAGLAQEPPPSGAAFFDPDNPILRLALPDELGTQAFSERIEALRAEGPVVGLVLSGGSARAFAHIGVLKALEEEGMRPDFLVADSMGAIVALLYAAGLSPDAILELMNAIPATTLFDLLLPTEGGFLDAGRFQALVRTLVGEVDLAALPIPVLIVCEDLRTRRQVLISAGELDRVMIAAFALPAVFEPIELEGRLLIDGGVTGLVPVAVAAPFADRLLAATALYDPELGYRNPFVVINRAIDIGKTRRSLEELDLVRPLVIRCDVEGLSYMEFANPRLIAERGYDSTRAIMPEIKAEIPQARQNPALSERREALDRNLKLLLDARARGEEFSVEPDFHLNLVSRFLDESAGGDRLLQGRRYVGLEADLVAGRGEYGLALLSGLEGQADRAWGLRLQASLSPFGALEIEAEALFSGPLPESVTRPPAAELLVSGELGYSLGPWAGSVLRPFARGEAYTDFSESSPEDWDIGLGIGLVSAAAEARCRVSAEGLWYMEEGGAAGPAWDGRFSWSIPSTLSLRCRAAGRYALEGTGFSPNRADGYRGPLPETSSRFLGLGSLELAWLAGVLSTDIGEMFILERPELAPYLDVLIRDEGFIPAEATAGLAATVSLSVLGLAPFELSACVGMTLDGSDWIVSLRTGRLFN